MGTQSKWSWTLGHGNFCLPLEPEARVIKVRMRSVLQFSGGCLVVYYLKNLPSPSAHTSEGLEFKAIADFERRWLQLREPRLNSQGSKRVPEKDLKASTAPHAEGWVES